MKHILLIIAFSLVCGNIYSQSQSSSFIQTEENTDKETLQADLFSNSLGAMRTHRPLYSGTSYTDKPSLGNNIISITPLCLTQRGPLDTSNMEIGLQYEHISDNGKVGFFIPVSIGVSHQSFFISPGFKFYPGKQGVFRYAIGAQATVGSATYLRDDVTPSYNNYNYNYAYYNHPERPVKTTQFGLMINNSANLTVSQHFYFGADVGLGLILMNSPKYEPDAWGVLILGPIMLMNFTGSFGIHTGFRF